MRDPIFLSVVADFFINLTAGWFAASIVFSPIIRPGKRFNFWVCQTQMKMSYPIIINFLTADIV